MLQDKTLARTSRQQLITNNVTYRNKTKQALRPTAKGAGAVQTVQEGRQICSGSMGSRCCRTTPPALC